MPDSAQIKQKQTVSKSRNRKAAIYVDGDRVAERPINRIMVTPNPDLKFGKQRFGTVVGHRFKVNKRGSKERFLIIQWDHLETPCEHAQHRICHIDKLAELKEGALNAIG
jgi:hypothetical protein